MKSPIKLERRQKCHTKKNDGLIDITEGSTEVATVHPLDFVEQRGLEHFTLETLTTEVFDYAYIQLLTGDGQVGSHQRRGRCQS